MIRIRSYQITVSTARQIIIECLQESRSQVSVIKKNQLTTCNIYIHGYTVVEVPDEMMTILKGVVVQTKTHFW